jgi:hypothetical protein
LKSTGYVVYREHAVPFDERARRGVFDAVFQSPRRGLSPRVAAGNKWRRIEALRRNRAFLEADREAPFGELRP